jgi:hypothetical protein
MRIFFNLVTATGFGVLGLIGSLLIAFAFVSLMSHNTASGSGASGVECFLVAVLFWPLHVFVALFATAATFLLSQSRDARRADEALAEALRESR